MDRTVRLWDVETGERQRPRRQANKAPVRALAFSRDGQHFATAGAIREGDRTVVEVLLWDTKTWDATRIYPDQAMPVQSLAFSPDGSTLALGAGIPYNSKDDDPEKTGRVKTPGEFKLWKVRSRVKEGPKQEQEKEGFTAWGKQVGGLQAGLGFRPGERRAYHHGETVTLVVRVRNVGQETVKFEYLQQFLDENPPTVTGADGKTVPQVALTALGFHVPVEVSLAPGKEVELASRIYGASGVQYDLRPASEINKPTNAEFRGQPFYATGKVSVHHGRVLGDSSARHIQLDPALSKLATGKLEIEIKPAPPPDEEKPDLSDTQFQLEVRPELSNAKLQADTDKRKVQQLIEQLDNDDFAKREQASNELKALGRAIVPQLEAALDRTKSPEARRRLVQLLEPYRVRVLTDLEKLQGTWKLVEAHMYGKKAAARDLPTKDIAYRPHTLAVDGHKIEMHLNMGHTGGVFELDTTKKLKEITINWLIQWPAVYKLEGDTLTICFHENANLPRPDEFRTLADSDRVLLVYQRAKPNK
jgi:uncharacterized protein (TIGR03067 family)